MANRAALALRAHAKHEAAARLAATVFVLFAQEHLQHGHDGVLGFDVDFITAFLVDIVQEASLTLEALRNEVISVDQEGSASCLVGQHDFAVIFGQQGGPVSHRSRLQRILYNLSPIAEGSSVAAASADFAAAAAMYQPTAFLSRPRVSNCAAGLLHATWSRQPFSRRLRLATTFCPPTAATWPTMASNSSS